MPGIVWDEVGDRTYESGLDRGVLYLPDGSAVPWNGLLEVTEKQSASGGSVFFDGMKISELVARGPFLGSIKAITYPDEITELEGLGKITDGVFLGEQNPKVFSLSWRTRVGNDIDEDAGYKLHVLYNVTAVANDKTYATLSDSPEASQFEWDISAIPVEVEGFKPTAHVVLDSRTIDPEQLQEYENMLYGTASTAASLVPMPDFVNGLYFGYKWKIIDNGDGTWTAITPDDSLLTYNATKLDLPGTAGSSVSTPWVDSILKGLYLPGTNGRYASSPDHSSLDIVGDLELILHMECADWSSVTLTTLAKWNTAQQSYALNLTNTGELRLYGSTDGTATTTFTASSGASLVDGQAYWIRATIDVDNGSGQSVVNYYKSSDPASTPVDDIAWTLISTHTHAFTFSFFSGTAGVGIGANSGGTSVFTGFIRRAVIRNGLGGAAVFDVDFTDKLQGWSVGDSNGATGIDATGKTVTINGTTSRIDSIFDIRSDLDLRCELAMPSWQDGGLIAKWAAPIADSSYCLYIDEFKPYLYVSNGTSVDGRAASVVLPFAPGAKGWVRATYRASDGRIQFFTSTEVDPGPSDWVQLGTDQTTSITAIHTSTTPVVIGDQPGLTDMAMTIYHVVIFDGIDDTFVASPDFTTLGEGDTTFEDAQGNEWTVNGAASIEIEGEHEYFTLREINAVYLTPELYQIEDTFT